MTTVTERRIVHEETDTTNTTVIASTALAPIVPMVQAPLTALHQKQITTTSDTKTPNIYLRKMDNSNENVSNINSTIDADVTASATITPPTMVPASVAATTVPAAIQAIVTVHTTTSAATNTIDNKITYLNSADISLKPNSISAQITGILKGGKLWKSEQSQVSEKYVFIFIFKNRREANRLTLTLYLKMPILRFHTRKYS